MKYYHGSIVPNLKELIPFNTPFTNADKACVYLTSNYSLSILYLWVRKFMWLTYSINEEGVVTYTESFQGSLKTFYKGVKGYCYHCDIQNDVDNLSNIKTAITVYDELEITNYEVIDDAYEEIIRLENEGKIIIRRFEELNETEIEKNNRMVINAIKNLNLHQNTHPLSHFVKKTFPEIWNQE